MMRLALPALAALCLAVPGLQAQETKEREKTGPTIAVGDAMPTLTDVTWLKGEPVPSWKPGQIYVIDFWATWCSPCKRSMPHLNDLARRYRDEGVTLIGVAIWPRDGMVPTEDFVKANDEKMDYPIAVDVERKTAAAFMDAVGRKTIPSTMIIGRDGTLVWHGNPFDWVDDVLSAVVEDRYDADAWRAEFHARTTKENKTWSAAQTARKAGDYAAAADGVGEMIARDPLRNGHLRIYRYELMIEGGLLDQAAAWGREIVKGPLHEQSGELNKLAWKIVDPEGRITGPKRDLTLARIAADRANELSLYKSAAVLDTVARVMFLQGEIDAAIETQRKAVELSSGKTRASLDKVLQEYISARDGAET